MPTITNIPEAWTEVAADATNDELWQVLAGQVALSLEAPSTAGEGYHLAQGDALPVPAGATVRYRRRGSSPAIIYRGVYA